MLNDASIFRVKCFKEGQSSCLNNVAVGGLSGRLVEEMPSVGSTQHCLWCISPIYPYLHLSVHLHIKHPAANLMYLTIKIWILLLEFIITRTTNTMRVPAKTTVLLHVQVLTLFGLLLCKTAHFRSDLIFGSYLLTLPYEFKTGPILAWVITASPHCFLNRISHWRVVWFLPLQN